jgi:transposase
VTGANRNDVTQLLPLVDGIGPVAGKPGRPRQRPDCVVADRGYDHDKYRRQLWRRGVKPMIARRQTEHGSGLGRWRWVVERAFAWLHNFRRLRIRWERRHDIHLAFQPSPAREPAGATSPTFVKAVLRLVAALRRLREWPARPSRRLLLVQADEPRLSLRRWR